MRRTCLVVMLACAPSVLRSQAAPRAPVPDECYGFTFGAWDPPLKSVASQYNPGYDPKTSAPAGAPRDWAARIGNGKSTDSPADSVLLLFPVWWPAGISIEWGQQRGDTLMGRAVALVADGRVKNPVSAVRATRVACRATEPVRRDTVPALGGS